MNSVKVIFYSESKNGNFKFRRVWKRNVERSIAKVQETKLRVAQGSPRSFYLHDYLKCLYLSNRKRYLREILNM